MKLFFAVIAVLFYSSIFSQYYYNDIVASQQSAQQYQLLRTNKVKKIIATSFEDDNTPTEGFLLEQELSIDGKKLTTRSSTQSGKTSTVTSYYELGKLKRTIAYNNGIENKMELGYDEKGRIKTFSLVSADTAVKYKTSETREWLYNTNGQLTGVLKIKNKTDTTEAILVADELGNIVEEHWKRKQKEFEVYYYYYNANNKLTDIVRFNNKLKKLVPDYLYEYDNAGRMIQMTQQAAGGKYFVWRYSYNEKGLKQKEVCLDKDAKTVGTISYSYEF